MSIENPVQSEPRVDPVSPEEVQEILDDAPEAAKANMKRAEKILGALDEDQVPENYDNEAEWGFTFTGTLAHDPELFKIWWAEEGQIFEGGNLDRGFKELLAAVIAYKKGAEICIAWHTTSAKLEDVDPERYAIAASFEENKQDLPEKERKAIEYAIKTVENPEKITDKQIKELKDLGYTDKDIIEITATAGTAAKFANFAISLNI